MQKVLILGATGMLGHVLFREMSSNENLEVYGSARNAAILTASVPRQLNRNVVAGVDAQDFGSVHSLLRDVRPDIVVNCIGVIKQDPRVQDSASTVAINSMFPHLLARECGNAKSRLIHISTDCVFSGSRGNYTEDTPPDPQDFYGRSKLLGEVSSPSLVLRTSIIGHELAGKRSLLDWFLSNTENVRGFTRAIYSGVTTVELARLVRDIVIPRPDLTGLVHVASESISKYDLLRIVAKQYSWPNQIIPSDEISCDRSMSADKLFSLTGYRPPGWPIMIREMYESAGQWKSEVRAR